MSPEQEELCVLGKCWQATHVLIKLTERPQPGGGPLSCLWGFYGNPGKDGLPIGLLLCPLYSFHLSHYRISDMTGPLPSSTSYLKDVTIWKRQREKEENEAFPQASALGSEGKELGIVFLT